MKICPRCKKPVQWEGNLFRPFCSERCQQIDLSAWFGEEHRLAGEAAAVTEDETFKE